MILATQEPQAAVQLQTQETPEVIELKHEIETERNKQQFVHYFSKGLYIWNRILTVLLTLYAVNGVWSSIEFILVTNPALNEKLTQGIVTSQEVNDLSVMAITLVITTVVSVVLAVRLHNVRRETGPTLDLILAMIFLGLTTVIESLVSMIDFVSLVGILF